MSINWCNVYFHFVIVSETAVQVFRIDFLRTVDLTVWTLGFYVSKSFESRCENPFSL